MKLLGTFMYPDTDYTLSCTFPSGIGSINVIVIWKDEPKEVQKFELNPETSIEVSVPLSSRNET